MKNIDFNKLLKTAKILTTGFLASFVVLIVISSPSFFGIAYVDSELFWLVFEYIFIGAVFLMFAFVGCIALFLILSPFLFHVAKVNEVKLFTSKYIIILLALDVFLIAGGILGVLTFYSSARFIGYPCEVLSYVDPTKYEDLVMYLKSLGAADYFVWWALISFGLALLGIIATSVLTKMKRFNEEKVPLHLLLYVFGFFLVLILFLAVMSGSLSSVRVKSIDARRITDVKQVQLALELYFDSEEGNRSYPMVSGTTSQERWNGLRPFLVSGVRTPFIPALPNDLCFDRGIIEHQYDYKNSPDGKSYVIKAILSSPGQYALKDHGNKWGDADGEVLGIWCGEEGREIEYCLKP